MITKGEGRELMLTMKFLSAIGMFPFSVDMKKGKLVELPPWRFVIWVCSVLLSITYYAHATYRAFVLFVLKEGKPVSHSMYILNMVVLFMATTYLITSVHTTLTKRDVVMLVFNELFQKDAATTGRRPWKKAPMMDTILRVFSPVMVYTVCSSWATIITVQPELPVRAINNPALEFLKSSYILLTLNFILDLYACGVKLYYFQVLINVYFLTCEKAVAEAKKAMKMLRGFGRASPRTVVRCLKTSRWIQLFLVNASIFNSSSLFAFKLVYITCSIGSSLNGIQSENKMFFRICSGIFAVLCIGGYNVTCIFANRVVTTNATLRRRLKLAALSQPITAELRVELKAEIRSIPVVAVRVGGFHAMERESFLIFINFVVDQVVALLILG